MFKLVRVTLLLCASLLIVHTVALAQSATSQQPNASFQWERMVWVALPIGDRVVDKAVLAVNIALDGLERPALMQLDLGTPQTIIYGVPYGALGGRTKSSSKEHIRFSGTVAGLRFENESFALDTSYGDKPTATEPVQLGTLGADFFNNRLLLLDFVDDKLAILENPKALPSAIEQQVSFVPLQYRNGKVFVKLRLAGHEERDFFYDTGSSALPLVTTRERWLRLTSRQPGDPANEAWNVKSWGKDAALIGAPIAGSLCVGRACIESPTVYFESSGLQNLQFDKYKYPASGLIGNALFVGRYSLVVDLASQRLGLMEGSLSKLSLSYR